MFIITSILLFYQWLIAFYIHIPPVEDLGNSRGGGVKKQLEIPGGGGGSGASWASILGASNLGGTGMGGGHILPHVLDKGGYLYSYPTHFNFIS